MPRPRCFRYGFRCSKCRRSVIFSFLFFLKGHQNAGFCKVMIKCIENHKINNVLLLKYVFEKMFGRKKTFLRNS